MSDQVENRSSPAADSRGLEWLCGLGLMVAVFMVYQPVWNADYIWDDDMMLTNSGTVVGPFGLKEIWTTGAADICPFTLTTLWLGHKLWGLAPMPYHLLTIFFHAAGAVVLWRVLRALAVPGAWLGAALWALHPVQVESVAWISEMKNTESGLFYLLSILFFVKWRRAGPGGGVLFYALTVLFAALAMLSKSSTVVLPVVFCLLVWWMDRDLRVADLRRLVPFVVLALLSSALAIWTQHLRGADNSAWMASTAQHLQIAGAAIWFYLAKLFWPYPLMVVYPQGTVQPDPPFQYLPLLAAVAGLGILWYNRRTWGRPWFFVAAYFVVALLPVLGLVNNTFFEYSPVFDHFQYLASMGPLAMVGAGIVLVPEMLKFGEMWLPRAVGGVVLFVLGILTLRYAPVFHDEVSLWTYMLKRDANSWAAYTNLGIELVNEKRPDDAMAYFKKALEIHPTNPRVENAVGTLLDHQGKTDEAVSHFQKAIEIDSRYPRPHTNLGNILAGEGRLDEAIAEYQKALELAPNDPDVLVSLGVALARKGQGDDATPYFEKATSLYPNNVEAHYNLGNVYLQTSQVDAAIAEYQAAEKLNPDDYRTHANLGRAFAQQGRMDEAIAETRKASEGDPKNVAVRQNLGRLLAAKGEVDEAISQLREALKADNHNAGSHNILGTLLEQQGKLDDAVSEYKAALDIDPTSAEARRNLGFAYFQQKKLNDAEEQLERSMALNPNDVSTHNNLGIVYGQQGKLAKAKEQFEQALELRPGDDDAQRNLLHIETMMPGNAAQ